MCFSTHCNAERRVGGTCDSLDPEVIKFWEKPTDQLYEAVPDMAAYLVKADSEDQPGPLLYYSTLSQGSNLFADALKPMEGFSCVVRLFTAS